MLCLKHKKRIAKENSMLSTDELKNFIIKEINSRMNYTDFHYFAFEETYYPKNDVIYIFSKDDEYHVVHWGTRETENIHKRTKSEREVLWNVVNYLAWKIATDYEHKHCEKGKDFRRLLFEKEIEICSLYGTDFEERKRNECEEILKMYPYED